MSAGLNLPKRVADAISENLPSASRRDFLKSSGALLISVSACPVPGLATVN